MARGHAELARYRRHLPCRRDRGPAGGPHRRRARRLSAGGHAELRAGRIASRGIRRVGLRRDETGFPRDHSFPRDDRQQLRGAGGGGGRGGLRHGRQARDRRAPDCTRGREGLPERQQLRDQPRPHRVRQPPRREADRRPRGEDAPQRLRRGPHGERADRQPAAR